MGLIMQYCDVHTQMVCQYTDVLKIDRDGQYKAVKRIIEEEDVITLRCLCKWAQKDNWLCRMLSILFCFSIDANKMKSFQCIMSNLPTSWNLAIPYEFGGNTVWVWALMHSAARYRPHCMHILLQNIGYKSHELSIAYNIAQQYEQVHASHVLRPFCHEANTLCPYRRTPFAF